MACGSRLCSRSQATGRQTVLGHTRGFDSRRLHFHFRVVFCEKSGPFRLGVRHGATPINARMCAEKPTWARWIVVPPVVPGIVVTSPAMDVLPFPPRPSAPVLRCGMQTSARVPMHIWPDTAQPGDLCLCGRRILPAKASLSAESDACTAER